MSGVIFSQPGLRRFMPELQKHTEAKTRTSDVKEIILNWIRQGKYPPGSQLPSVPELVSRLEVSRTVVREALQTLAGMNFIEIRAGLGCFVKSIRSSLIVNADVMAALIDMDTLIEVAIARKAIEGSVARLAATDATADDFEAIEIVLERIKRQSTKNQPMYTVTPEFHVAVAQATHNQVLKSVVSSFNLLMVTAGEVIERDEIGYEYRIGEYQSHLDLFSVLKRRNADLAQLAMQEHVQKTVDALERVRARRQQKTTLDK